MKIWFDIKIFSVSRARSFGRQEPLIAPYVTIVWRDLIIIVLGLATVLAKETTDISTYFYYP